MDKLIGLSKHTGAAIFCATEYEAHSYAKRARDLGVDIKPPVCFNSAHQGTRVILSKPAKRMLEEMLGIIVVGEND